MLKSLAIQFGPRQFERQIDLFQPINKVKIMLILISNRLYFKQALLNFYSKSLVNEQSLIPYHF